MVGFGNLEQNSLCYICWLVLLKSFFNKKVSLEYEFYSISWTFKLTEMENDQELIFSEYHCQNLKWLEGDYYLLLFSFTFFCFFLISGKIELNLEIIKIQQF